MIKRLPPAIGCAVSAFLTDRPSKRPTRPRAPREPPSSRAFSPPNASQQTCVVPSKPCFSALWCSRRPAYTSQPQLLHASTFPTATAMAFVLQRLRHALASKVGEPALMSPRTGHQTALSALVLPTTRGLMCPPVPPPPMRLPSAPMPVCAIV